MRISEMAWNLLKANKIKELQTLPLEGLLDAADYAEYQRSCKAPETQSVFKNLNRPVVVSNGRIYSEFSARKLFKSEGPVKCYVTNVELLRDRYGLEGEKKSFVHLPQLIAAKKELKNLENNALKAKAAPVGFASSLTAKSTADIPPPVSDSYTLRVNVSGSKMRILITSRESDLTALIPALSKAFKHKEASMIPSTATSYSLAGCGRCWQVKPGKEARLEFWFPPEYELIDDKDINALLNALLRPLMLTSEPIPPGIPIGSINSLLPRDYKDAIEPVSINLSQVIECCNNFVAKVQAISDARGIILTDVVDEVKGSPATPATHSGMMFFGERSKAHAGAGTTQPPLTSPIAH